MTREKRKALLELARTDPMQAYFTVASAWNNSKDTTMNFGEAVDTLNAINAGTMLWKSRLKPRVDRLKDEIVRNNQDTTSVG